MSAAIAEDRPASSDFSGYFKLGLGAVIIVFGVFGGWAALAPLDSATVASARVSVDGERKPIQHLEGGIVRDILVHDGETVEEGQVLFRLQPTQAQANTDLLRDQIDQATALEARLIAEYERVPKIAFPDGLMARRARSQTAAAMADQERQFSERRRTLDTQLAILRTRAEQTTRQMNGDKRRIEALEAQLSSYEQEIKSVKGLADKGYYPRNKLKGLERDRARVEGDLGGMQAEYAKSEQVLSEARLQIEGAQQRMVEEATQQLAEVRAKVADVRQKLAIAEDVLYRVDVRSPRRGIVFGVKVPSPGTVVGPGAMLAEIVPAEGALQLSARISPLDIQNVMVGQVAQVRFPGLSNRQTPALSGQVENVSADSITEPTTGETYFSARIAIDRSTFPAGLVSKMTPGVPAEVLISTGERTALAYLLGPLRDSLTTAMRER